MNASEKSSPCMMNRLNNYHLKSKNRNVAILHVAKWFVMDAAPYGVKRKVRGEG